MNQTHKIWVAGLLVFGMFIGIIITPGLIKDMQEEDNRKSWEDCVTAGNPIMESEPRQCQWPDGTVVFEY